MNMGRRNRYPERILKQGDTYVILDAPKAQAGKAIRCLRCNRTSYNPSDVTELYCGYCGFHSREKVDDKT
jgi:ribosomal protein L37E